MANISSLSFQALRPGALYRVVVTTVRVGHVSRQTVSEGRTGKKRFRNNTRVESSCSLNKVLTLWEIYQHDA